MSTSLESHKKAAAGGVLATLAAAQFLMTLDMSVMNVSIATVANDLGTTVTGLQTAITLYTLVMATLMITGGKLGAMFGRRRMFALGCVIYGAGSLITALSPNLTVLIIGWSVLEGVGAALIMPAIVALVAANFEPSGRSRAYGLIASAGAIAVAVGPLIGGLFATYSSWRWVFVGEVLVAAYLLVASRKLRDSAAEARGRLDIVGTVLSVLGLGLAVYGVLRASEWGWITAKPGGTSILGLSPTIWLVIAGCFLVWLLVMWERRLAGRGGDPLITPGIFANRQLSGGLAMFLCQFLVQAGLFFVVPLFLSVVLELSPIETGVRLVPLSLALLIAAAGVPRVWPTASPRRVVRVGMLLVLAGMLALMSGIDPGANAAVVTVPLVLVGLGIGALASQLGAVTVSAVPTERAAEVGGLQNTATNLGASLGTAIAGSMLIGVLTTTFLAGAAASPEISQEAVDQATVQMSSGAPFISDTQLQATLTSANVPPDKANAILDANRTARIRALDAAIAVLAVVGVASLFVTGLLPTRPPGTDQEAAAAGGQSRDDA